MWSLFPVCDCLHALSSPGASLFCSPVREVGLELPASAAYLGFLYCYCYCSGPHGRRTEKKSNGVPPTLLGPQHFYLEKVPLPRGFRCWGGGGALKPPMLLSPPACHGIVWGAEAGENAEQKNKLSSTSLFHSSRWNWRVSAGAFSSPQCPFWIRGRLVSSLGNTRGKMRRSLPVQPCFKFWLSSSVSCCSLFSDSSDSCPCSSVQVLWLPSVGEKE